MKSGIVKMSIVFIVLFIIFIFLLLRYRNTHMQVMQFEDLSDSTKVSLYYMDSITDEYEHEYTDKKEIEQFAEFFKNRKYSKGKANDKDGFGPVVVFAKTGGDEITITIQTSGLLHVEAAAGDEAHTYESDNILEEFEEFYTAISK